MNKEVIKITPNGIKQAIDDLLEENNYLQQELNQKNKIIDKAIEYIKLNSKYKTTTYNGEILNEGNLLAGSQIEDLLEILKGEENE